MISLISSSTSLYFFLPTVKLPTMSPKAHPIAPTSPEAPPPPGVGEDEDNSSKKSLIISFIYNSFI